MNFKALVSNLLGQADSLVPQWLPGGRMNGREYVCGSIAGGPGDSFRVNMKSGKWAEFSGTLKGGDLLSLYAAIHGINNGEAYIRLGGPQNDQPEMKHPIHGLPLAFWIYRDPAGNPIMYVARYNTSKGKEFLPWRKDGNKWICKGIVAPRPLYGLDLLASRPDAPVLVCEGEKATEAARPLAPQFVVITWPNGAQAWSKTNFAPIYGRKVVLWPDADKPGIAAMNGLAKFLADKCPAIKILKPKDKPEGWDAADAQQEGITPEVITPWIRETPLFTIHISLPSAPEETLPTESQYAAISRLGLAVSDHGKPICNAGNVVRFLQNDTDFNGHIWFDEFSAQIMTDTVSPPHSWNDTTTNNLMISLQTNFGLHRITAQMVYDGISFVAHQNKRHQVRDWLTSLEWDGKERIGNFFITHMGADASGSIRAFGNNFWVLMVKRIMQPGCQADYMVVLEGGQGIGKTRALRIIGGPWYAEVGITADSEDFERQLQGKVLVEIAELHSFSKADQSRIKQIITKCVDRYREKYGKIAVDHPRQCVLAGTTNESEWIKDQTGGRRFWPIHCGDINLDTISRDRDQLFAEAFQCVKDGDEGYLVPTDETFELQEARREHDDWEDALRDKISFIEQVTLLEAMNLLGIPMERMDGRAHKRVAHVLKQLGFKRKVSRIEGELKRLWVRNGAVTGNNGVTNF